MTLTHDVLLDGISYDPGTGIFAWINHLGRFAFSGRKEGARP